MRGNRDLAGLNEEREQLLRAKNAQARLGARALDLLRRGVEDADRLIAAGEAVDLDDPVLAEARALVAEADALTQAA